MNRIVSAGMPELVIDGRTDSAWMYMTNRVDHRFCADVGRAGIDLYSFHVSPNYNPKTRHISWRSDRSFDFSEMDVLVEKVIASNARARFILRVFLFSTPWWNDGHPDELMRYSDGETCKPTRRFPEGVELPSWASPVWRNDTGHCLREMIRHAARSGYGDRIVGYHLASGGSDEWYYYSNYRWFFGEPLTDFLDYGPAQTRAFRDWLVRKYNGDISRFAEAWNMPGITFAEAEIASPDEKRNTHLQCLIDPARGRQALDTFQFEAEVIVETIDWFARAVKEATEGRALTGAFYGYILGAVDKAYCATRRLLESTALDFVSAPSGYGHRMLATGVSYHRAPVSSIHLHGKLWWEENDYYTHLKAPERWAEGDTGATDDSTTVLSQSRQLAHQICTGVSSWWYDMDGGWYDSPAIHAMLRQHKAIADRARLADRGSVAEIAVVVDEPSMLVTDFHGELYRALVLDQMPALARIGAPVDWLILDDLPESRDYKLLVFANALYLTETRRESLLNELDRRNTTVVWIYAPGLAADTLSAENLLKTCGVHVEISDTGGPVLVELDACHGGIRYGTERMIGPHIRIDDSSVEVLGTIVGSGCPGFVRSRKQATCTYFSVSPGLPPSVLRRIADEAGVHIYVGSDEALYANRSFIGLHAAVSGTRTIYVPDRTQNSDLYDLFRSKPISVVEGKAEVELVAGETLLAFRGARADWESKASTA